MGRLKGKLDDAPEITAEVDFGRGFVVDIKRQSPDEFQAVAEARTTIKNGKLRTDRKAALKVWCKAVLRDWRGLTPEVGADLLKIVPKGLTFTDDETKDRATILAAVRDLFDGEALPYSPEDAYEIALVANPLVFIPRIDEALNEMWEEDQAAAKSVEDKSP
jgi:hypothetical protein